MMVFYGFGGVPSTHTLPPLSVQNGVYFLLLFPKSVTCFRLIPPTGSQGYFQGTDIIFPTVLYLFQGLNLIYVPLTIPKLV